MTNSSSTTTLFTGYIDSVVNVSALRNYCTDNLTTGATIIVDGHDYIGDANGGIYVLDTGSTTTDDGLHVVTPSSGDGRWLLAAGSGNDAAQSLYSAGVIDAPTIEAFEAYLTQKGDEAAGTAQAAASSATLSSQAAQVAQNTAVASAVSAQSAQAAAAASASAAQSAASAAASVSLLGSNVYPNAYATALPHGVTALSSAGVATGTGGTAGTYLGGVSGGPTGFAWTYTIGSDGKIASYAITQAGLSTATTAPTLTYPSGGITGATVPVATVASTTPQGGQYWSITSAGDYLALYSNDGTATPAAVIAGGVQAKLPLKPSVDTALATLNAATLASMPVVGSARVNADGTIATGVAGYSYGTISIPTGATQIKVTASPIGTGNPLLAWYSDTGGATFLSRSTEPGGTTYSNYVLSVPTGAKVAKINGPTSAYTIALAPNVADRLGALESSASDLGPLRTSLTEATNANVAVLEGSRAEANGSLTTGLTGYRTGSFILPSSAESVSVTASPIGSGTPLIVWYSDTGATSFLARSTESGGVTYSGYSLPVPAGAVSARINGSTSSPVIATTSGIGSNVAQRVNTLEGYGVSAIASSLFAWQDQAFTINLNQNIQPDGTVSSSNGYTYATIALTGLEESVRATGTVIGTGRYLATYYSDTACTQFLSHELLGSGGSGATYTNQVLNVPSTARGLGINSTPSGILTIQVYALDPEIGDKIKTIGSSVSTWKNKNWAALGDSITANNNWEPPITTRFGFAAFTNCGLGGSDVSKPDVVDPSSGVRTSMCDDARINALPIDADLIVFMGGVNDHGHNKPLGAITAESATSFDNTTFYGALETVATKLLARYTSTQRIIWMTPTFADRTATVPSGWSDGFTNTLGLTIFDYADAVRAVARKYGFPVIDLLGNVGWNRVNIATYVTNEGGTGVYIHPNAVGATRMAELVAAKLPQYQPWA